MKISMRSRFLGAFVCVMLFCAIMPFSVKADTVCMIKVPMEAKVIIKGIILTDENLVKVEHVTGRIHDIALQQLGLTCGYKQYMVVNLASPEEVAVYSSDNVPILPTFAAEGIIDYTGAQDSFYNTVSGRIREAAATYHNRTGGYGSGGFTTCFLQGSDAYAKCVASDSGRKWGQYVRAATIQSIEVADVYRYSENAFTAKATILATSSNYTEKYSIYMLFQKLGGAYYVTNFTFMP